MHWAGRKPALELPENLDVPNAGQIRRPLLAAIDRGATVLIATLGWAWPPWPPGAAAVIRLPRSRATVCSYSHGIVRKP